MNLIEVFQSSKVIAEFDTEDQTLINNKQFVVAWTIAREKALENMQLVNALLLIKNKYNINDFEFELFLENIDETNLFSE